MARSLCEDASRFGLLLSLTPRPGQSTRPNNAMHRSRESVQKLSAQGATAALMVPQVLATLHLLFSDESRSRAFAVYGIVLGLAGAMLLGPLVVIGVVLILSAIATGSLALLLRVRTAPLGVAMALVGLLIMIASAVALIMAAVSGMGGESATGMGDKLVAGIILGMVLLVAGVLVALLRGKSPPGPR